MFRATAVRTSLQFAVERALSPVNLELTDTLNPALDSLAALEICSWRIIRISEGYDASYR